jgi:hypothetical protein
MADLIAAVVSEAPDRVAEPDTSLLEHYTPDDDFLYSLLMSPKAQRLLPDHPLVPLLTDFIPRAPVKSSAADLAYAITAFVRALRIDPHSISLTNVEVCYEYWASFGFAEIAPPEFCHFLDAFIRLKCPWMPVLLYLREVDWQCIPQRLWDFVATVPHMAPLAHGEGLLVALSCICAANALQLADLPIDALTLSALPQLEPPEEIETADPLTMVIQMEWNHVRPRAPDFGSDDLLLALRQTIVYLRFFLPVLMVFDPVYSLVLRGLQQPDHLAFFYSVRILAIIADATTSIPSYQFLQEISKYALVEFTPFLTVIEPDIKAAFKLGYNLTPEEFTSFMVASARSLSKPFVHFILPLFQYFNAWDLVQNELQGALDFRDLASWRFITAALDAMPPRKRIESIPALSARVRALLPTLSPRSRTFELLALSFPVTVYQWFASLDAAQRASVEGQLDRRLPAHAFKSLSKNIQRLKLESTSLRIVHQHLAAFVTFREDDGDAPTTLELRVPALYPLEPLRMSNDINDPALHDQCENRANAAMLAEESVEAAVRAWHAFVVAAVRDDRPCTICFRYFDAERNRPDVACGTCGIGFHRKCLRKWFERCLRPVCPFCACPWRRAG